jgi:hypothetical protein
MPTSGTVAQTQINVATLIDTAFRRAGKSPTTVSGELLGAAQNALYFLCAEMVNRGVNLFCVRKNILNVRAETAAYSQSIGTTDILNVLYRTLQEPEGLVTRGPDFVQIDLYTASVINNVSGYFDVAGTSQMVLEYKDIFGVWKTLVAFGAATVDDGSDFASDIQRPLIAKSWRIRDASGNEIVPKVARFRKVWNEINMSQLNRDDYVNLPNKYGYSGATSGSQRGLQFWHDKQINPVLYIWPISNQINDQIVVYQHGQIEDVGDLTNELAVPARWYEAIIFTLASRLCLEIAPAELPPGRLEFVTQQAGYYTAEAGHGESDGSSYKMTPRIGGYTA